jgi:PAS domain S-box-containing protein
LIYLRVNDNNLDSIDEFVISSTGGSCRVSYYRDDEKNDLRITRGVNRMAKKPTYEELEERVRDLDNRCRELEIKKEDPGVDSENFTALAEKSSDGITVVDPEGRYLYANGSAAESLGYKSSELLKMTFRDLVHPGDRDMVSRKFEERTDGKTAPSIYEARFVHKDGSTVFLEVSGTKTMWEGRPASLVVARNITERRAIEFALLGKEEILRATLESTADGVCVVGEDQKMLIYNSTFASMWRIPERIVKQNDNRKIRAFVMEQIEEPEDFTSRTVRLYGTREEVFDTLLLKDGRVFERRSNPLIVRGELEGRVWNFRDVTEKRLTEKALAEAESKYRDIVESSGEGIFQTTPEGRPVFANKAMATLLGYDSPEDLMNSVSDIGTDVYVRPEKRAEAIRRIAEHEFLDGFEAELKRKDGTVIWGSLSFRGVFDEKGNHVQNEGTVRDISLSKKMEKELQESEARYRGIFENTGTPMAVIDKNETIVRLNREFEKLSGYRKQDLEGKMVLGNLSTPEETERIREDSYKRLKRKDAVPRHYETVLVTRKGERRDVVMTVFSIPETSRQILSLIDVTDRKAAEQELRESEEKYRSHFDNVGDMIFTMDRNLKITSVSPSVKKMLGYDPEDFIGKDFSEVKMVMNTKEYRVSYLNARKILEGEAIHLSEYEFTARDGRKVSAEISGHPMFKDGHVVGTISVVRDVTARKAAEEALKESVGRYEHLVKHAPAGIYELDYDKERFTSVNDVMCEYLGYTRDEFLSMNPFDLFAEESRGDRKKLIAGLQENDEPGTKEYRVKTKDGNKIWILLNSRISYEKGRPKGATGVIYNITKRKESELALVKSEERLRRVLEKMPMMLVAFDKSGNIIVWNSECERITGYMADEAVESIGIWERLFPDKDYRHWVLSEISKLENLFYDFEVKLACKDGSEKTLSWSNISKKYPVPGWSFWGVGMDTTEIKEAQAILEQANVKLEEMVEEKRKELNEKADKLDELNAALKVLVNAREDYKRELEENIVANFKQLVTPHLDMLKKSQLSTNQIHYFGILENYMDEIISPFARDLSSRNFNLTPQEIKVAGLIKDHKTTKEIARLLHISQSAVIFHRHNIRKKLDLIDKKVNLESYLRSFV